MDKSANNQRQETGETTMNTFRLRLGALLNEETARHDPAARFMQRAILGVIILSCCNLVLATIPELAAWQGLFQAVEAVAMLLFTAEYFARLWCRRSLGCGVGFAALVRYLLSPYLLIDLIVLIPFYVSLVTDAGQDWLAILRLLRLIRLSRNLRSGNILWSAFQSKAEELVMAIGLFLFVATFLAMGLYVVENPVQPENFSSFFVAVIWVFAKLIQGIGGYAEFAPLTVPGQILATLCGISFIAVFAIPAGLIASGFMDELGERKKRKEEADVRATLDAAFMEENLSAHIRAKEKHAITGPRQSLTLNDVIYRLFIPHDALLAAVSGGEGFQIRNYRWQDVEKVAILRYEVNCPYGTLYDRASPVTIISTHSGDQTFMGHFTARLAEALKANYLSVEKYFEGSMLPEFRLQLRERASYIDNSPDEHPVAELFKNDLAKVVRPGTLAVYILAAASTREQAVHILNGGTPGQAGLVRENATCACVDDAETMLETLRTKAGSGFGFTIGTHEAYGNDRPDSLGQYLHKHLQADALCFHVSVKCFNSGPDVYYGTIRLLADAITDLQTRRRV